MYYQLQSLENQILANSYAISLTSFDGERKDDGTKFVPSVEIENESSLLFQVSLPSRRLWNYTVLAHGCDKHPVMDTTFLSIIQL